MNRTFLQALSWTGVLCLIGLIFLTSCSSQTQELTEETAAAFCEKVATKLNDGNDAFLDSRLDQDKLIAPALEAVHLTKEEVSFYPPERAQELKIGKDFAYEVRHGAHVDFIRVVPFGAEHFKGLFRFSYDTETSYYFSLFLFLDKSSGEIRIADVYLDNIAESISDVYKSNVILLSANQDSSRVNILNRQDAAYYRNHEVIQDFFKLINESNYYAARSTWNSLPEEIKNLKPVATYNLVLTGQGFPEQITAMVDDYRKRFPKEPAISYLAMGKIATQGWTEKLDLVMSDIRESLGGDDAGLLNLEAHTYMQDSSYSLAESKVEAAIQLEPDFQPSYWSLLVIYARQGKMVKALDQAKILYEKFGVEKDMQVTGQGTEAFYQSDIYKNWAEQD